jgi:nucleoside-diphosphate-sugar epimerase
MRVLVTEATGFLGKYLVCRLLSDSEAVSMIERLAARYTPRVEQCAEVIIGTSSTATVLRAVLKDVEAVGKDAPRGTWNRSRSNWVCH